MRTKVADKLCADTEGVNKNNAWDGSRANHILAKNWPFNILIGEARALLNSSIGPLNAQLNSISNKFGYKFVSAAADAFVGHGWCEKSDGDSPIYLPSTPNNNWLDGECAHNPSCWKPYQPRARFNRTVNDTLMTQTSKLGDGINGSMHPTAQGHAALANVTYKILASVIDH